jgi:hypothetical protein
MKISVLLLDEAKQIMLTPENEHEKSALKLIAPDDKIEAVTKWGTMFDPNDKMAGYKIDLCQGGYYRGYPDNDSLIFLITKKEKVK